MMQLHRYFKKKLNQTKLTYRFFYFDWLRSGKKVFLCFFHVCFQKCWLWFCKQTLVESNMKKLIKKFFHVCFLMFFHVIFWCNRVLKLWTCFVGKWCQSGSITKSQPPQLFILYLCFLCLFVSDPCQWCFIWPWTKVSWMLFCKTFLCHSITWSR